MEHEEGKESTETVLENCSTKKGFARFRCNVIQAVQIVFFIFVAMIFIVIALDTGTAEAQTRINNQMIKRLKDVSSLAIVTNPGFKYRFIYEREMKSVLLERTNKVRGSRVNLNIVLRGKDKNATYSALKQMNFNIQEQALLKRKFNQYQINPSKLEFADFVFIRPTMIEAFGKILSDQNGIVVIKKKSKYTNIAKIMGLRVIPMHQLKRDIALPASTPKALR
jgi:hypothetical protein